MKRKGIFLMCMLIATTCMNCNVKAAEESKNGFTYDTKYNNASWTKMEKITVKSKKNGKLGTLSYLTGVNRRKGTDDYIVMFKEVMTPNNKKVTLDNAKSKGYGLSEYCSLKTTLPTLDDYKPQNSPKTDSVNVGIGASKKAGPQVSATYTIKNSELDITSNCSTPKKEYRIVYDYKPHIPNALGNNKYLANESIQLGTAQFHSSKKTVSFKVNYDARFGAACDKERSPWHVQIGYVKRKTGSREYSFTVKKK